MKFDLVINLKTTNALNTSRYLALILAGADKVIE